MKTNKRPLIHPGEILKCGVANEIASENFGRSWSSPVNKFVWIVLIVGVVLTTSRYRSSAAAQDSPNPNTANTSQTSVTNAPNNPLGDSRQTNTSRSFTLPPPPTLDQFTTKDAEVQFQLGLIYERGIFGVETNLVEAAKWIRKAAEQ